MIWWQSHFSGPFLHNRILRLHLCDYCVMEFKIIENKEPFFGIFFLNAGNKKTVCLDENHFNQNKLFFIFTLILFASLKNIFFSCLYSRFTCKFREISYSHKFKSSIRETWRVILVSVSWHILYRITVHPRGAFISVGDWTPTETNLLLLTTWKRWESSRLR